LRLIADFARRPPQPSEAGDVSRPTRGLRFVLQGSRPTWTRTTATASPFLRLCSGPLPPRHEAEPRRTGKTLAVQSPMLFFGQERQIAEDASPAT
jgi:peptide chain release factor 3